jgi:hypothetical protein
MELRSPWTTQIKKEREVKILNTDLNTDICIVGGGISGVVTAYNILKHTDRNVTLIESHIIAHGATGHNAGQLVAELERSIFSLVEDFGFAKTIKAIENIESSWIAIEQIMEDLSLKINYSTFLGYNLYSTAEQIKNKLEDLFILKEGNINIRKMLIAQEYFESLNLDLKFNDLIDIIQHKDILSLSETKNTDYIAAFPLKKGCLNSALFTEKVLMSLLEKYTNRFYVYEESPVKEIIIEDENIVIKTVNDCIVNSQKIILCTNGFENFDIKSNKNTDLNFNFHKHIKGLIGYMFAKTENMNKNPEAFAYYDKDFDDKADADSFEEIDRQRDVIYSDNYTYTTRRHYDLENEKPKNLFCIGGISAVLEDSSSYNKQHTYDETAKNNYLKFINDNLDQDDIDENHKEFMWHGLMGYTGDGIRLVGYDNREDALMYNLGCNGIGILPAIWGGKRIADLLNGDTTESLFDPRI